MSRGKTRELQERLVGVVVAVDDVAVVVGWIKVGVVQCVSLGDDGLALLGRTASP